MWRVSGIGGLTECTIILHLPYLVTTCTRQSHINAYLVLIMRFVKWLLHPLFNSFLLPAIRPLPFVYETTRILQPIICKIAYRRRYVQAVSRSFNSIWRCDETSSSFRDATKIFRSHTNIHTTSSCPSFTVFIGMTHLVCHRLKGAPQTGEKCFTCIAYANSGSSEASARCLSVTVCLHVQISHGIGWSIVQDRLFTN